MKALLEEKSSAEGVANRFLDACLSRNVHQFSPKELAPSGALPVVPNLKRSYFALPPAETKKIVLQEVT